MISEQKLFAKVLILFFLSGWVNADQNPWADGKITCVEMEQSPEAVFNAEVVDLGSGAGSPNQVDYQCPQSLGQLTFLHPILSKADVIRQPATLPRICTGSIVHAQSRYQSFGLAWLGYYPQGFPSESIKASARSSKFFQEWSYHSPYNRRVYEEFEKESERVRSLLIEWYKENHLIDTQKAQKYADMALTDISNWGFGSFPSSWEPEEMIEHTDQAMSGHYDDFLNSLQHASDVQKLNSLRRLLFHSPPNSLIEELVSSISNTHLEGRSESVISNAIGSPAHLRILLRAGFDPNHQNEFGKTPLYYAVQFKYHESARVLLANGADVNHKYQLEDNSEYEYSCIGITQWGRTPLMHAAQHSDLKMVQLLLDSGANIKTKDVNGSVALDYASAHGKKEIERYLSKEMVGAE
ncbi:MAG: ankyrin repeat domain-containing protein [bacterium]|nr:ankyrin repeat domain-containing protein [bacterium]